MASANRPARVSRSALAMFALESLFIACPGAIYEPASARRARRPGPPGPAGPGEPGTRRPGRPETATRTATTPFRLPNAPAATLALAQEQVVTSELLFGLASSTWWVGSAVIVAGAPALQAGPLKESSTR